MSHISMNKFFTSLLLVLVVGFGMGYMGGQSSQADRLMTGEILSEQDVIDKVTTFLQDNFLSATDKIEIPEVKEASNLYALTTTINGQTSEFYATKDGALFFPQMLEMNPPADKEISKSEKPAVDLFIMAFCPYGNDAESQMKPVVDALADQANFNLHYIIYQNYQSADNCLTDEMKYCSMHTKTEVNQDIRELCVQKYQPDKLWDFILKINTDTDATNVEEDWEGIAQEVGLDIDQIKTCQQEEGTALLDQELTLTDQLYPVQSPKKHRDDSGHYQTEVKIQGSPTIVINGIIYDGKTSVTDYQKAICSAFINPPAVCQETLGTDNADSSGNSGTCQ